MIAGSVGSSGRRQRGSVRSAEGSTWASRRSSFAPAGEMRSRKTVELLGVDRVDGEAPLRQVLDHSTARGLHRDADFELPFPGVAGAGREGNHDAGRGRAAGGRYRLT